jgi:hypothetical protein
MFLAWRAGRLADHFPSWFDFHCLGQITENPLDDVAAGVVLMHQRIGSLERALPRIIERLARRRR